MPRLRRLVALLCIFAVIAAALLAPLPGAAHVAGILVPLAPLFGFVLVRAVRPDGDAPAYSFLAAPPQPSRAPPRLSTV